MLYKRHIDGLRAFAILPVLLFHLNNSWVPGGFAGVDIFFVISGFLITGLLCRDLEANRFSLLEFYKRRVLRIFPALFLVLIVTAIVSELILFPSEKVRIGNSIATAAAFSSNFLFWKGAGYFAEPSETNPLLHTWTLAVEEQFYIFFPLLLFFLFRQVRRHVLTVIMALSLASFAACVLLARQHSALDFYLLPPRAWEFGLGAGLAVLVRTGKLPVAGHAGPALIGLGLILASFTLLNSHSVFPGWNAIYPCLGATLLIGWAEGNPVGRLLSLGPFVWIGQISYSVYLWHWPAIVFWKIYNGQHLSHDEMILLGVISILLGAVSTRFIERPFRSPGARKLPPGRVIVPGMAAVSAMACIGLLSSRNLLPALREYPDEVLRIAEYAHYARSPAKDAQYRGGVCFITSAEGSFARYDKQACATPDPARPNVLLMGDSHSAHYWKALQDQFPGVNIMQATASGCRPLIGAPGEPRCTDMRKWVFETFLPDNAGRVDAVVIGARWEAGELHRLQPTLERLKTLVPQVVLLGPTVEYLDSFPYLLARNELNHHPVSFRHNLRPGRMELSRQMQEIAGAAGVTFVDIYATICSGMDSCTALASDGTPMQFDYGHLTLSGSRDVIARHAATFAAAFGRTGEHEGEGRRDR